MLFVLLVSVFVCLFDSSSIYSLRNSIFEPLILTNKISVFYIEVLWNTEIISSTLVMEIDEFDKTLSTILYELPTRSTNV